MSLIIGDLISYVPNGGTWGDIPPHLLPERYRGMRRTADIAFTSNARDLHRR